MTTLERIAAIVGYGSLPVGMSLDELWAKTDADLKAFYLSKAREILQALKQPGEGIWFAMIDAFARETDSQDGSRDGLDGFAKGLHIGRATVNSGQLDAAWQAALQHILDEGK